MGGNEAFDFEQDFVKVLGNPPSVVQVKEYNSSCSEEIRPASGTHFPPVSIVAGTGRQGDSVILLRALVEIGVSRKDIATKNTETIDNEKSRLILTIGPKPP